LRQPHVGRPRWQAIAARGCGQQRRAAARSAPRPAAKAVGLFLWAVRELTRAQGSFPAFRSWDGTAPIAKVPKQAKPEPDPPHAEDPSWNGLEFPPTSIGFAPASRKP